MGAYKELFIFVEGDDDDLFFSKIIKPSFKEKYDSVVIYKWAQKRPDKIDKHLKSIKSERWNADYIFVADMDTPCVTAKKEKIQDKYKNVEKDKIIVVAKEIESWYLAGLDDCGCKNFRISPLPITDGVNKEEFTGLIPKKFRFEIDFFQEILNSFDTKTAKQKNKSFRYFVEKYDP